MVHAAELNCSTRYTNPHLPGRTQYSSRLEAVPHPDRDMSSIHFRIPNIDLRAKSLVRRSRQCRVRLRCPTTHIHRRKNQNGVIAIG